MQVSVRFAKTLMMGAAIAGLALSAVAASAQDIKIALISSKTGLTPSKLKPGSISASNISRVARWPSTDARSSFCRRMTRASPTSRSRCWSRPYSDDNVDLAVGTSASGSALAMLSIAEDAKKILIVEPAVADSITGDKWNRYIFRTARNSTQDALAGAVALGTGEVSVATLAQDYAFGRDGVTAIKDALTATKSKAKVVFEGIRAAEHHRFHGFRAAPVRRAEGQAGPQDHRHHLGRRQPVLEDHGAEGPIASASNSRLAATSCGAQILQALSGHRRFGVLLLRLPEKPDERLAGGRAPGKRFNVPPDFFTAAAWPRRRQRSRRLKRPAAPTPRS